MVSEKHAGRWADPKRKNLSQNHLQSLAIDIADAPAAHSLGDAAGTGERGWAVELLACITTCRLSMPLVVAHVVTRRNCCAYVHAHKCTRVRVREREREREGK